LLVGSATTNKMHLPHVIWPRRLATH